MAVHFECVCKVSTPFQGCIEKSDKFQWFWPLLFFPLARDLKTVPVLRWGGLSLYLVVKLPCALWKVSRLRTPAKKTMGWKLIHKNAARKHQSHRIYGTGRFTIYLQVTLTNQLNVGKYTIICLFPPKIFNVHHQATESERLMYWAWM